MDKTYAPIEMSIWDYVGWLFNNSIVFVVLSAIFILLTLAGITRIILEQCGVDCEVGFNWNGAGDFLLVIAFGTSLLTLMCWTGFGNDSHVADNMESNIVAKYGVTEAEHLERISKDTNVYRMEIFDDKSFEHGTLDFWFDAETGEPTNSLLDEHGVEEGLKKANALKVTVKK